MEKARLSARYSLTDDGRVVCVATHHDEHAAKLGFEFERVQVVVVFNPEHPINPSDIRRGTIRKYTINRRHADVQVDFAAALKELQTKEPNWTGDVDKIQSPANSSSFYKVEQVMDIVHKHLQPGGSS